MQDIIVALITGLCVAVPSVIATFFTSRKTINLLEYRLSKLEERVQSHNNLIDRMYKIEMRVTLLEDEKKGGK